MSSEDKPEKLVEEDVKRWVERFIGKKGGVTESERRKMEKAFVKAYRSLREAGLSMRDVGGYVVSDRILSLAAYYALLACSILIGYTAAGVGMGYEEEDAFTTTSLALFGELFLSAYGDIAMVEDRLFEVEEGGATRGIEGEKRGKRQERKGDPRE